MLELINVLMGSAWGHQQSALVDVRVIFHACNHRRKGKMMLELINVLMGSAWSHQQCLRVSPAPKCMELQQFL